jgi:hypothetical protein
MSSTVILLVCYPSDFLVQYFHKPTDIVQAGAPGIDEGVELVLLVGLKRLTVDELLRDFLRLE